MTGNCGFADGVMHQHSEVCYQAGRREALAPQPVTDQYVQGLLFAAELARNEARWQEEQNRRGVPGTEYARDRALQIEGALRSVAAAVEPRPPIAPVQEFREGECAPPAGCGCMCHQPGGMAVAHMVACCEGPVVTQPYTEGDDDA